MLVAGIVALWGLLIIVWCAWVRPVQDEKSRTGIAMGKAYALAAAIKQEGFDYHLQVRADKLRYMACDIADVAAGITSGTWWQETRNLIPNTRKRWELRRIRKNLEKRIMQLKEAAEAEKTKSPS